MEIEIVKVGYLSTNCYVLALDNHVLVIDPGDEYDKIEKVINNRIVDGVLITHHHFDHIGALSFFDSKLVYDYSNLEEGIKTIGKFKFEVIKTPGHKEDCISFYFEDEKMLFCGDFIFYESIGRTDLLGGNMDDMLTSIKKTIIFNDDVKIYPGHGISTTFRHERKYNMYFSLACK